MRFVLVTGGEDLLLVEGLATEDSAGLVEVREQGRGGGRGCSAGGYCLGDGGVFRVYSILVSLIWHHPKRDQFYLHLQNLCLHLLSFLDTLFRNLNDRLFQRVDIV